MAGRESTKLFRFPAPRPESVTGIGQSESPKPDHELRFKSIAYSGKARKVIRLRPESAIHFARIPHSGRVII